jgi:predicted RNase H-like HicB family nuclease
MLYTVNIVIEKDEGGYYARCLDIDVGEARADSLEEVIKDIKEMIGIKEQRDCNHYFRNRSA